MLKVQNLSKTYASVQALNKVSFSIKRGEIVGFLGPNGAGKTTTLRIITGCLVQDSGVVTFDNRSVQQRYGEVISDIGYLPENNPLYNNLRVDEFLMFTAGMKNTDDKKIILDICDKCGLKEVLSSEIDSLSKGYKQRVGLARTLIGDPKFLILDEPTEGLDPNQKQEVLNLIKDLSKEKTVLFSSHVLSEVTQIADRVIIIHEGKIVAEGKSEDLVKQYFKNAKIFLRTNAPFGELRGRIKAIKTVSDIRKFSGREGVYNRFEIVCSKPEESSLEIFSTIARNHWKLSELYTKSQGLEELFRELTK